MFAILAIIALLFGFSTLMRSKAPKRWNVIRSVWSASHVTVKLKILISFYMIVTRMDTVYGIVLPNEVLAFIRIFQVAVSFGLEALTAPFECLQMGGYLWRLGFWMLLPILVLAAIFGSVAFWLHRRKKLTRDALISRALPPVLKVLFVCYPIVTNIAFEAFSCYRFTELNPGDLQPVETAWLRADVRLKCDRLGAQGAARALAITGILIYPVGMLIGAAYLLFDSRRSIAGGKEPTVLSEAISFLHREFEPHFFWWELVEMFRRFLLVGILLLASAGSLMQISIGTLASVFFLLSQMQANPYKQSSDNYLATAASLSLLLYFLCCVVFKVGALIDSLPYERADFYIYPRTLTIFAISTLLFTLIATAVVVVKQVAAERERLRKEALSGSRRLRHVKDNRPAVPITLPYPDGFHIFLSHTWAQGQSDMRVVKQRLVELMPDVRVFLDVDNLEEGAGAEYIDRSECVLAFCTRKYFNSRACARELMRAVLQGKPIIAVLEPEQNDEKGGLTVAECKAFLLDASYTSCKPPANQGTPPKDRNWCSRWELDGEVKKWGIDWGRGENLATPTPQEVAEAVFGEQPLEWSRFTAFQDVTMRLIAERVLPHDHVQGGHPPVYVQGEVSQRRVKLPPLAPGRTSHLYCSPYLPPARALGDELQRLVSGLVLTESIDELDQCEHMLLYLTSETWTRGEASARFAHEVCEAQRKGVHLLLAHEFPSVLEDERTARHACNFNDFWSDGWTPRWLLAGDSNVYKQIAIALKPDAWRTAGLVKLGLELAKGGGPRERWRSDPLEPGYVPPPPADRGLKNKRFRKLTRKQMHASRVAPLDNIADISTPPGSVPTGAGLEVTDVEEDYWVLSKCIDGKLTPVPIDTLHSDKAPLRVTCTGKGSGLPFTPVEGAFYFGLDWPKQKEATVHEAAPQLGHFLLHHVPRGSRVLLCSFSAGCFWTLIADPAAELRVELEAKPIECRMCVPNAAAIEGTDVAEIGAYLREAAWVTLAFTIHDWEHKFKEAPKAQEALTAELLTGLNVSSATYLKADDSSGKLSAARMVYIGDDGELRHIKELVSSGQDLSKFDFALHGSTQKAAHTMLHAHKGAFKG